MNEQAAILKPDRPSDRERAIIEADRLAQLLREEFPSADEIKDCWFEVNRTTRAAIAEIRSAEARATGQLTHTTQNEYLGVG